MKKSIDSGWVSCYTINCSGGERDTKYGGIAQLGERLNGIQEVSGSIPLISTIGKPTTTEYGLYGGIAQLGVCVIESMPPLSDQQSTTSYSVPRKLPFLEIFGGIAQLGERLNGIQEVSGSIPLISTKGYAKRLVFVRKQAFSLFSMKSTYPCQIKHSPRGRSV